MENPPFCFYKPKDLPPEDYQATILMDVYWVDRESGYAIALDSWAGKFRYFRFGCKHEFFETRVLGRGHTSHVCKECGMYWQEDTTD
jgi:hypothetical protein